MYCIVSYKLRNINRFMIYEILKNFCNATLSVFIISGTSGPW